MKLIMKSLILTLITSFLTLGCNKVNDLNTKKFDANFSANIDCVTSAFSNRNLIPTFSASAVIDPTSDPNVNLYLSNIEGYEIKSIKATVLSVSQENVTITSSDLTIFNFVGSAGWYINNEKLIVGKVFTLGNENEQFAMVGNILKTGQEFTVIITGEADFSSVTFTIKVDIETNVTAKII